jgi:hypothetical protein
VLIKDVASLKALFLTQLKNLTCEGRQVSHVANCIADGQLCSNAGDCVDSACKCDVGRLGQYCESFISASAADTTLPITLGTLLPTPTLRTHFIRVPATKISSCV